MPGVSVAEPVDVAREGLENLANGPVFIAGGNAAASLGNRCGPLLSTRHVRMEFAAGRGGLAG